MKSRKFLCFLILNCLISLAWTSKKYKNIEKLTKKLEVQDSLSSSGFVLSATVVCSESQFQCKSDNVCIPLQWKCDLASDCEDGSDENEEECGKTSIVQSECDNDSFFHCKYSRKCIRKEWVCDDMYDCGLFGKFNLLDTSDEKDNRNCAKKCPKNQLSCSDGTCLHIAKFCDGHVDCVNDELNCKDKSPCSNLRCDYACKVTPDGPKCYCPDHQDIANTTKCTAKTECSEDFSEDGVMCDQLCSLVNGKNKCTCASGYERINQKCYGNNSPPTEPTLLFALTPQEIYKIILPSEKSNIQTENSSPVTLTQVLKLKDLIAMEMNFSNHTVCVMENFEIFCYNASNFMDKWKMPQPDFFPLYEPSTNVFISHFAHDWVSRNWYFMDTINSFIFVCSHEMTNCRIIIQTPQNDLVKFRTFVIDPTSGYLFLTKYDLNNRTGASLVRYSLDGTNKYDMIKTKIFYPHDMTLDVATRTIYFLDYYFDFIQQCDYDGNNRKFLQKLPLVKLHRIAFFENNFYGAINQNISLLQISKSSSSFKRVLAEHFSSNTKSLKIFHQQAQPQVKSKVCTQNNKCEHLCVPVLDDNNRASTKLIEKCLCKEGFESLKGKCVLKESNKFIMFVQEYPRMIRAIETDNKLDQTIAPIVGLNPNVAFDVDFNNKLIYFTSYVDSYVAQNNTIEYRSFNGSVRGKIKGNFGNIQSMAYDWIGKNLYFSSSNPKWKISVLKLDSTGNNNPPMRTLVSKNFLGPSSIALDVENGTMFWTSFAEKHHIGGKIETSWMDGTNREVLVAKNVNGNASIYWPVSLTYCKEKKKLYWLDVLTQTIESINLVGVKMREQRKLGNSYAQSLTVLSNTIYLTDNMKNNIESLTADSTNVNKDLKVFYRSPSKKSFLKSGDLSFYNDHVESRQQMSCPGLWLNTPIGGVCLCGDGYSKNGVGSICVPSKHDTTNTKQPVDCPELTFACKSGDECIDHYYVCDGTKDCSDGSDELDSNDGPCQKNCDFRCDGNKCIEFHQVCDSVKDCQDESDETVKACSNKTIDYNEYEYCDEFLCENFNCILLEQRCDGVDNCGDNSDEKECLEIDGPISTPRTSEEDEEMAENVSEKKTNRSDCKAPDYYCEANQKCIPVHKFCDGISDCPDNSDESGRCSERLCDKIVECQFFCHNAPNANGYVCSCPQHMTLENDERSCSEPKTCDDFSACSQLCIQLNPSKIRCKCFRGYRLKEDNFTCESEHIHDPILLVSNRHILRGINLKSHKEVKNYHSVSKNIIGIDFYYDRLTRSYEIVWSDITNDKIYLGKLRGDDLINIKAIVESDLSSTEAVAIDWIGKNVYWIDASLKQIEVATKDGLHRTTLISENISKPRSMALDSRLGYLFWSDWEETEPRIERSSLAGEDRKSIFNLKEIGGEWPNGITLDYAKKRVYFLDAKSKEIHTIDYNGKNHRRIYKNPEYLYHPFAITIYENNLYWSDWRLNAVITANKFTGSNVSIFYQATIQPFDVKIMHPSRQPWDLNGDGGIKEITSPCENSNCSHLCLLSTNNSYKCACPYMMRLSEHNPYSCEKLKDIMFYTTNKSEIRAIELEHPYSTAISTIYHISQIIQPDHIAIHPKEKRIYWSDSTLREIKSVKLSTSITPSDQKIETILDTDIDKVHGFTVDWNSELLFFSQKTPSDNDGDDERNENESTSSGGHRMLVSNLKGEYLAKVLDNVNAIFSITIASKFRKIFYVMKNDTKHYEVRYCNMDGSNDTLLVREDEPIQSLSFDSKDRRLYFVKNNRKIFYRDLKTDDLKLVNTFYGAKQSDESYDEMFITSLEVFGDFIYFGDGASGTIRKCDKTNCKRPETYRKNTPNIRELRVMALSDSTSDSTDVNGCYMKKEGAYKKCDHLCIPIGSSNYVCKCAIGYEVDKNDPSKCVGYDNFLVYSLGYEMKGLSLNSNEQTNQVFFTPLQKVNVISNFDFDAPSDFIYFSDNDRGEILRIKKDGSSRQTIMSSWDNDQSNSDWLGGIAVDWIAQNIYWTDQKRGLIEVSRLDGSFRRVIVSQLFRPSKIAVDPLLGLLFFGTAENKIYSLNLDGTSMTLVTKKSDIIFNDFVIDIGNQTIYFCETRRSKIWKIDYDGNGRKELNVEHVNTPISLDIIDNKLYWAERGTNSIKSVNLDDLSDIQTVKKSISNHLKSLKIFSQRKQHGSNPCIMPDYGYCQELCLYNGTKPNCFCSHGYLDPTDQKSCRKFDNHLFISRKENIERISIDGDNDTSYIIDDHNLLHDAVALAYDIKHKLIYFSDFKLNAICVSNFQGSRFEKLIEDQRHVEGIAFNPQDQHIFWTLNGEAEIRGFDINLFKNGTYLTEDIKNSIKLILKLQTGVDKLRAIFVEPCLNMIYYSNWNSKHPSISRIFVTGYGNEDLITTEIFVPNALTLDQNDKKIFWADARLDKIERCDYDGKNRVILSKSAPKHPFSIAVFEDFIFWSDWILHGVLRANKYSGNDVIFLKKEIDNPMGIVVVQEQNKNCTNGICAVLNGGCEDICLPHGDSFKCECAQGYLAKDGRRCLTRNKLSSCNSTFEFECRSGECIPLLVTCDSIFHCSDNSDEAINYCATRKCPQEAFFQCRNFKCIYKNETCNGVSECGDGSDEENCSCADDEFKCTSGECMKKKVVCDFDPDCKDASDEMGCEVRDCSANPGFDFDSLKGSSRKLIPCPKTTACYLKEWECDGENDCWDGSDELDCETKRMNTTCSEFTCKNNRCLPSEFVCDGEDDCNDGNPSSDEKDCQYHCSSEHFSCDDQSRCIPLSWLCDSVYDCNDKSDEANCTNGTNATEPITCGPDEATCLNGECILKSRMCDDIPDCHDSSDENELCALPPYSTEILRKMCNQTEFTCENGECINLKSVCDLKFDCSDNSDENSTMCEYFPAYCTRDTNKFLCQSGSCISYNLTCNGYDDCGDFSDEERCNINECEYTDCEHKCQDLKIGYECICNAGFKLNTNDSHTCDDINECEERPCSQLCLNTYGSFHCECLEGYVKKGNSCKIDSPEHPKLIFSNRFYIRSVTLDGHAELLLHNSSNAVAIDFDWSNNYIYYSDVTQTRSEIIRVKWNGNESNNREVLHQQNMKNPDGIAFDWIARNLYWCDKGRQTIEVSKDNGRYRKILIEDKLDEPRAIVLDPYRKYFYWSDWGRVAHIGRAGMDGSNPHYIITGNLGWPNALTISFETNELFFGDAREDFIGVSDLDGRNRKIVAHRKYNPNLNLHHIFSIAVWEDRVYFSDWESKSIEYCDKYTGLNCGTLIKLIHRPMDLRVFHPIRQKRLKTSSSYESLMKRKSDIKSKDGSYKKKYDAGNLKDNPCAVANCSALCLLSPISPFYQCACPDNFFLGHDKKTCIANCTSAQFHCKKSMKCIPFFWKCDGQADCEFKEDEPENCPPFHCDPGQFQCDLKNKPNATCLDAINICDGTKQCLDGKDEENCENYGCFIESYFQCEKYGNSSAFCIPKSRVCNDFADCPSGNDERNCTEKPCSDLQFKCESNNKCIPKVWQCDGDADCPLGEDEKNCHTRQCAETDFRCSSGRCIPLSWTCDSDSDCPNEEDEGNSAHCDISSADISCDPSYFKCNSSRTCIPGRWKCDGARDCEDSSDEEGCEHRNCSESEFRCNDGRCIMGSLRCNKEYNCYDFSDEENCTVTCDDSVMFRCANKNQCVDKSFVCDGEADCDDWSDEKNCDCSQNDFKCGGDYEKCIQNDWLCDGIPDCPDKSDEHDSRCLSRSCAGHAHKCSDGKCIPKYFLCDGIQHCDSDEKNCNAKKNDNADAKTTCTFGSCSQVCIEKGLKGSLQCKCAFGYHKSGLSKNATCRAIQGQHLIFTASESELRFIYGLNYGVPNNHNRKTVMPVHSFIKTNSSKITSFDYVVNEENDIILFWIDSMPTNNLQRIKMSTKTDFDEIKDKGFDGRNATILTKNKQKNSFLKAISVDWITSKIYFIENDLIKAVDYDGNYKKTIIDGGLNSWDLIVDPESRKMFWSTMMRVIYTASMDGSQKKKLVNENIEFASSLAIDYPSRRLYWADIRKSTIETVTLKGLDRQIVRRFDGVSSITNLPVSPAKLDIFEDELYVTMTNQTIYRLNKFGIKKDYEELNSGPYKFKASHIKIVHTFKHNLSVPNPCILHQCDESAICFLSATEQYGRSCNCPDNLYIQKNGTQVSCLHKSQIPSLCYKSCVNGGKCKFVNDEMKCECPPQFEGEHCEHYICSGFCNNHGVCSLPSSAPSMTTEELKLRRSCTCTPQWRGPRCEVPESICKQKDLCHNGGTCTYQLHKNGSISEICKCPPHFNGSKCEKCDAIECQYDSICYQDANSKYRCLCSEGYSGIFCERDRCKGYCKNNGKCTIKSVKGPVCKCEPNFSGETCEIDDRPCTDCPDGLPSCDMQCQNGGFCRKDSSGIESCMCVGEWSGIHCEFPPRCINDECGKCNETSSINECLCKNGLVQACTIFNDYTSHPEVVASEIINNDHETMSVIVILSFTLLFMSTLAIIAVFYVRRWQRRVRFFNHARLNENVEEITNPIFDFSATDRDDINLPVTSISNNDDKGHFTNPLYESMYSSSHKGLLEKKSDDDEEEMKNELL